MRLKPILLTFAFSSLLSMSAAENGKIAGVNPANIDNSVDPRVDFYDYACGGWMKANPIGDEYSRYGSFDALAENNKLQLKTLFEELAQSKQEQGSVGQKVRDLYLLGMDSARRNREGAQPVMADIAKIQNMKLADLNDIITWEQSNIGSPFFGCGVEADLMKSDINARYLSQPGLGLPDRDYYIVASKENQQIMVAYTNYLEKIFTLVGYNKKAAKKAAKNIIALESKIAEWSMSREEQRDIAKMYNPVPYAQLCEEYNSIDWKSVFNSLNLNNIDTVIITQPKALKQVNDLMPKLSLQEVKDYLVFNYISSASSYLSNDFTEANFEMYSKTLQGTKEMQPLWKRALNVPNGILGEAVGELYVAKYFANGSKEKMLKIVNNLKIALGEHIATLPWMSETTKINALVKLNSFTVKIGYPDKWKDYSGITVDVNKSYWENVKNAIIFKSKEEYAKCGKQVDRDEWFMTPQTVNAYYNPTTNEICFPAGILQPPFFDVNADDASNYGAIGVVIGHEMTHGFDDQGRNFDQNGNMKDWWTEEDANRFKELTSILVKQYDSIIVLGDEHANGKFTLGENIADHGGLRVSYTAFKKTQQGRSEEKTDGFTPDQRFFLSYAGVWAGNIRDAEILRRTKTDPHSLGRWRVNAALKNIEPFFKAFNIKEGDPMFLAPAERVTIW